MDSRYESRTFNDAVGNILAIVSQKAQCRDSVVSYSSIKEASSNNSAQ